MKIKCSKKLKKTHLSDGAYNLLIEAIVLYGLLINLITCAFFADYVAMIPLRALVIGYLLISIIGIVMLTRYKAVLVKFVGYNMIVIPCGITLSTIISDYAGRSDLVLQALIITTMITFCMITLSCIFPKFFVGIGKMLFVALVGVVIAYVVCYFVGLNTGIDALHYTVRNDFYHPEIEWAKGSRLIAVTAHRRENLGEPMRDMFRAIRRIVEEFTDVKVIYPVHLNPQVRKIADEEFGGCERIHLIEPLDVVEFHNLMKASYLIMTDSGGIEEEAPALGKPVLVMRDTTERPEGVEAGTLKLAGTKMEDIYRECRRLLTEPEIYRRMSEARNKELPHD